MRPSAAFGTTFGLPIIFQPVWSGTDGLEWVGVKVPMRNAAACP